MTPDSPSIRVRTDDSPSIRVRTDDSPSISVRTDELRTVREAMRDFGSLLGELESGEVEKLVLTQRNRMRAVVVSVERWSEVEAALSTSPAPDA